MPLLVQAPEVEVALVLVKRLAGDEPPRRRA